MLAYYLIAAVHVLVCVILILVVLLQSGKGADLAGAFGGGATQTAFGSRGPASLLSRVTTIAAVVFMITSISLSVMGTKTEAKSILDSTRGKAPQPKTPAVQPQAQPPSPEQIKKMQQEIEAKQQKAPAGAESSSSGAQPGTAPHVRVVTTPPGSPAPEKPSAEESKPPSGKKP
jgi:preprotein translocase subunit SecG